MESQVVPMRLRSLQRVVDDPVLAGDEQDAPPVDGFVRRARHLAAQHVEVARGETLEKARAGDRAFRFSPTVRCLVEAIDA